MNPSFQFTNKLWIWSTKKAAWHFITVPTEISKEIKGFDSDNQRRGFGSIPIKAQIGNSSWKTSIFPDKKRNAYLLPIKADIRKKEKISPDDMVSVTISLQ